MASEKRTGQKGEEEEERATGAAANNVKEAVDGTWRRVPDKKWNMEPELPTNNANRSICEYSQYDQ